MTLTQLESFMKLAEELNFTKAAEKLYISQQGLSRQIKSLEKEFGFPLFERTTRSVCLTENGRTLYELLENHRRSFHRAISDAMLSVKNSQKIRLGILDLSKVVDLVMPVVGRLEQEYPHIDWEYQLGSFSELQDGIENNELDLICTLSQELPASHPKDQILILKKLLLCMFVSEKHSLSDRENLTIDDLQNETLLTFAPDFSYDAADFVLQDCKQKNVEPKDIQYFSNFNKMELALLSGKGIMVGYDIFFRDPLHKIRGYPISHGEGLLNADLCIGWLKPEFRIFAKIFDEVLETEISSKD